MGLLRLPQIRSDGVQFIEHRDKLYFNKYQYRARITCRGLYLIWYSKHVVDLKDRIQAQKKKYPNHHFDEDKLVQFYYWRKQNIDNKNCTIRVEGFTGAVFSNDLDFLKTLEDIGLPIDYTEIESTAPQGVRYFKNEPKYKYRFYLKSKRVAEGFTDKLREWVEKYEGTSTAIIPSNALKLWYKKDNSVHNPYVPTSGWGPTFNWGSTTWRKLYCSSHYFIDYEDESTLTLFMLVFGGLVQRV
jgi:hypothetical protein